MQVRKSSVVSSILLIVVIAAAASLAGCGTPYHVRRAATVPAPSGTPSAAQALGHMGLRAQLDTMPARHFMKTAGPQQENDPGLNVQTTQMGGGLRLGLGQHVNLGLRYHSGIPGESAKSHSDVAPAAADPSTGLSLEIEASWKVGRGYIGTYTGIGWQNIPFVIYSDKGSPGIYAKTAERSVSKPYLHVALMGGVDLNWLVVYGGVNIQTGYTNNGYEEIDGVDELFGREDDDAVSTVFLPPTLMLGAELAAFKYVRLGIQGWYTPTFSGSGSHSGGVGAWLAFQSSDLW